MDLETTGANRSLAEVGLLRQFVGDVPHEEALLDGAVDVTALEMQWRGCGLTFLCRSDDARVLHGLQNLGAADNCVFRIVVRVVFARQLWQP